MDASQQPGTQVPMPVMVLGRYALFGEIASGGMATVHFGRIQSLGGFSRTVAIKRMRRDIALDPEFVAMFLDEARLTARIVHPNVVAPLDVVAEAGEVFLVMEYVRGESLHRLMRASTAKRAPIPVPVAVGVICGALAGLHAAHEATGEGGAPLGIIHRDVSPQNILVGEDGIARITDFGIAKAESRLQVTHEGQMKGKLPYMTPEQLNGRNNRLDRRVDIFATATVLWEVLAGRPLFRGDHPGETLANVLGAPIPSLRALRSDVPAALDKAVREGLARNPDMRPATAERFASMLEDGLGQSVASPRQIGKWVASLASEVLAQRTRYLREIELSSASISLPNAPAAAREPQTPISSSIGELLGETSQPSAQTRSSPSQSNTDSSHPSQASSAPRFAPGRSVPRPTTAPGRPASPPAAAPRSSPAIDSAPSSPVEPDARAAAGSSVASPRPDDGASGDSMLLSPQHDSGPRAVPQLAQPPLPLAASGPVGGSDSPSGVLPTPQSPLPLGDNNAEASSAEHADKDSQLLREPSTDQANGSQPSLDRRSFPLLGTAPGAAHWQPLTPDQTPLPLGQELAPDPSDMEPAPVRSRKPLWLGLGAGAVAIAVVVVVMLAAGGEPELVTTAVPSLGQAATASQGRVRALREHLAAQAAAKPSPGPVSTAATAAAASAPAPEPSRASKPTAPPKQTVPSAPPKGYLPEMP